MINTNGVRIARDDRFFEKMARVKPYIYLQFDGLEPETYKSIRGEDLVETKLKALAEAIKKKLGPLALMMKMGAVKVPQLGLDSDSSVKGLLSEADRLIQDGGLSYCLITGRKPS